MRQPAFIENNKWRPVEAMHEVVEWVAGRDDCGCGVKIGWFNSDHGEQCRDWTMIFAAYVLTGKEIP